MSPLFVNTGAQSASASAATRTPSLPASRVTGNTMIAICAVKNNATISTATTGWTKDTQVNSGAGYTLAQFSRRIDGTEAAPVITWTGAAACFAIIYQYSHVKTSGAILGQVASNAGVSTTPSVTAVVPGDASSLIVTILGAASDYSADGFVVDQVAWGIDGEFGGAGHGNTVLGYYGTSVESLTGTLPGSAAWVCLMLELLPETQPSAGTKYVATTGSDTTGDGSSGNPYASMSKGLTNLANAATLSEGAGSYTVAAAINASSQSGITIDGGGSIHTIVGAAGTYLIKLGSNTTLQNIELRTSGGAIPLGFIGRQGLTLTSVTVRQADIERGVDISALGGTYTITSSYLQGNEYGMVLGGGASLVATGSTFISAGLYSLSGTAGLLIDNLDSATITNCTLWGQMDQAAGPSDGAIALAIGTVPLTTVDNCTLTAIRGTQSSNTPGEDYAAGIDVANGCTAIVTRSTFSTTCPNGAYDIHISGESDVAVGDGGIVYIRDSAYNPSKVLLGGSGAGGAKGRLGIIGTLSLSSRDATTVTMAWTDTSDGATPITAQLQKSAAGVESWSNVASGTTSPKQVTGTTLKFRVQFTDANGTAFYSNTVSTAVAPNSLSLGLGMGL